MTRLGEGHGLRLFPFPRAFPVIASVATPEPRRRRPQANVTPIPNRCQLEPIASPCRFEHFQALARSTRGNRAIAADRPRASPAPAGFVPAAFPIANGE